jgi:hypothetical protein
MSYNEEEDKKHREQHAIVEQPAKLDKQWMPEVGQECEWCGEKGGYFVPADVIALSDDEIVLKHKSGQDYKPGQFDVFKLKYMRFRPIQTEADKYRDE